MPVIQDALDAAADGEWIAFTPTTTINDVQTARTKANFDKDGAGGSAFTDDADVATEIKNAMPAILAAWGGVTVGTGTTHKGKVWVMGGGHADSGDSSLYQGDLNVDPFVWERLTDPQPFGLTQSGSYPTQPTGNFFYAYPTVVSDKQAAGQVGPVSSHAYGCLLFDEGRDCLWYAVTSQFKNSQGITALWQFDLATDLWSHTVQTTRQYPTTYDGQLFFVPGDSTYLYSQAQSANLYQYHVANDTEHVPVRSGTRSECNGVVIPSVAGTASEYDFIGYDTGGNIRVWDDLLTGNWGFTYTATKAGDTSAITANSGWAVRNDNVIYSFNATLGDVQTITMSTGPATATIADVTTSGATITATTGSTGNANRVQYMPDFDAFLFVAGDDPTVYLLKPPSAGGGTPFYSGISLMGAGV